MSLQTKKNKPCAVSSTGDERVDEEFMTIAGSNVERSIAIFVHTVDFSTWNKLLIHEENVTQEWI